MGYSKLIQYGDKIDVYSYSKNYIKKERAPLSRLQKKRLKNRKKTSVRSNYSKTRARLNFFRLVHHNVINSYTTSLLTLTYADDITIDKLRRYEAQFFQRLKSITRAVPLSYISVQEVTKKGRFHSHILVFDLPTVEVENERNTRNIQRQFGRGYVDIRTAYNNSEKIAGYMAKYMFKSINDRQFKARRAFNCSRNIKTPYCVGTNTLDAYIDLIVDKDMDILYKKSYDVPYLGRCDYKLLHNNLCKD